jgi:hypothetical protein
VEPNSTATTATSPGAGVSPSRFSSGLRTTGTPSVRRANGERRPTRSENTSNGSARANHPRPNSTDPTSSTTTYSATQVPTATRYVEPG